MRDSSRYLRTLLPSGTPRFVFGLDSVSTSPATHPRRRWWDAAWQREARFRHVLSWLVQDAGLRTRARLPTGPPGSPPVLPRCRLAVTPLHLIPRVGGHRAVPPQPPHHLRQDRPAELLPVPVHPPRVVHVVPLL